MQHMCPVLESRPPAAAEVLTKVTRDMVSRGNVSVTNEEAEVLVRTVLVVPSAVSGTPPDPSGSIFGTLRCLGFHPFLSR